MILLASTFAPKDDLSPAAAASDLAARYERFVSTRCVCAFLRRGGRVLLATQHQLRPACAR